MLIIVKNIKTLYDIHEFVLHVYGKHLGILQNVSTHCHRKFVPRKTISVSTYINITGGLHHIVPTAGYNFIKLQ